ncbi:MAG: hypothetical protein ABI870_07890 [Rhodanobacter sp.]
MRSLNRSIACIALIMLTGCVYWPHHYLTAPQITGTVTRSGKPLVGQHVQLADVMTQGGEVAPGALKQDAVTDAQGHFSIGPISRISKTAPVPLFNVQNKTVPWGLKFSADAQTWHVGWLTDSTLFGEIPKVSINATCDLDQPIKSRVVSGDNALVGNGRCDLSLSSKK